LLPTVLAMLWLCAGRLAWAQIPTGDVIDGGYRDCSVSWSGDKAFLDFTVDFKEATGSFLSRAIAVSVYDKTGKRNSPMYLDVYLNRSFNTDKTSSDSYGIAYMSSAYPRPSWGRSTAFTANVRVEAQDPSLKDWPAVAVHAANMSTISKPTYASIGALYVGSGTQGCRVVDPSKPPPSPVTTEIKVTAPDWDLGELERGKETTRTFATDAQRLCFSYDPKYIDYDKYLISASNRNGVAGNKFQLAGLMDPGVTVPYTLSLAGGDEPVALPSADGLPLTLGKSGRTCLTPTFKAWAGADIKGGDFSDVLTFTIVTKP
jgi:hypothetical protein